eukprot:5492208-Pleurochrysis_carterae.AAC.1
MPECVCPSACARVCLCARAGGADASRGVGGGEDARDQGEHRARPRARHPTADEPAAGVNKAVKALGDPMHA